MNPTSIQNKSPKDEKVLCTTQAPDKINPTHPLLFAKTPDLESHAKPHLPESVVVVQLDGLPHAAAKLANPADGPIRGTSMLAPVKSILFPPNAPPDPLTRTFWLGREKNLSKSD